MAGRRKSDIGRKRRTACSQHLYVKRKATRITTKENSAFAYNIEGMNYSSWADIGQLDQECVHCSAKRWKEESEGFCCLNGKVQLLQLPVLPAVLQNLLSSNDARSTIFFHKIRSINNAFAMTSIGCTEVRHGNYMPTFKISGVLYHCIGSLLPSSTTAPKFLQIYFVGDDDKEVSLRCSYSRTNGCQNLIQELQTMLHTHNAYVRELKTAYEKGNSRNCDVDKLKIIIKDAVLPGIHKRQSNAPSVNEIAAIISTNEETTHRDIIIEGRDSKLKRITETHISYDALQYPLLFPYGSDGYHINLKQIDGEHSLTAMQFYNHRFMIREGNYLLLCRDLLNQFCVDMFAKIEAERLLYCRLNQKTLRSEQYCHLKDSLLSDNAEDVGDLVILPSSYTGSPRYMVERIQDGMCYVRKYGTADLFITFTCNVKWPEISKVLQQNQKPQDRYDIISRVFRLKVRKLKNLIKTEKIFGDVVGYMCSIEWQKRGLPHAHILIWLKKKIKSTNIDSVISSELPDPHIDPNLYQTVKSHMIHGPCGVHNFSAPCMKDRQCSKRYPRPFLNDTQTSEDGYPLYRRRSPQNGGFTADINGGTIDNQWVVPYNPVLSSIFNAHINVEACYSVKSIKYICKYILKGSDLAVAHLQHNEIDRYVQGRYINSCEALWRIFGFPIHEHYPMIQQLAVHLENGQRIYFNRSNMHDKVMNPPSTTLTAFFKLCSKNEFAKTLLYEEVPQYFTWNNKQFIKRKQGTPVDRFPGYVRSDAIGRVYTVHITQRECFYLRMLLFKVRGPTSFEALRTYNAMVYPTYHAACEARGLLQSDNQWIETMKDAVLIKHPRKIREVFAIIIVYCQPSDPKSLYERFKDDMAADILYSIRQQIPHTNYNDNIYNEGLIRISNIVSAMSNGKPLGDFGLPTPIMRGLVLTSDYLRETSYNIVELQQNIADIEKKLNEEQSIVYKKVMASITQKIPKMFYLNAPGGTGKTTLMNLILDKTRAQGKIALAVASSGLAATLLHGGRTVHAGLKVPLTPSPEMCSITRKSELAQVLKDCVLIVWDECSMSNKSTLNAINNTLKFIRDSKELMGGITLLLGGDFRQTLPVVQRGTRADVINASLKSSHLWRYVEILPPLTKNMRLDVTSQEFAEILLKLGDGEFGDENGSIHINTIATHLTSEEELIQQVWPDVANIQLKPAKWIAERTILAPLNATVTKLNEKIVAQINSEEQLYYSIDTVLSEEDATNYPIEFLNSINSSSIPAHKLQLKIGVPIMLLRNLAPPKLCNGTRLIVKGMQRNIIEATILTGPGEGDNILIPRIPLIPADMPFQFKRLQFPVRVCTAITINKGQGQGFNTVGVELTEDCFSHGQLYVACSRSTNSQQLFICSPNNTTKNVVYPEIFY